MWLAYESSFRGMVGSNARSTVLIAPGGVKPACPTFDCVYERAY